MFLSDELEQTLAENKFSPVLALKLFECCTKRIISRSCTILETKDVKGLLTEIKRTDYAWREFCKKHQEINPDGFKQLFLKIQKPDLAEKLKRELNW